MKLAYERLCQHLRSLKLDTALTNLDTTLSAASQAQQSAVETLERLLAIEVETRFERRLRTNFRLSGLPMKKRLDDFDFDAQPQVPKAMIQELATLRFLAQGENVILIGPCGVGKTHLAVGLAIRALEEGHRVAFTTLHQLVSKVHQAQQRRRLDGLLSNYLRADLLVLDEVGFLPLQSEEANFLFELVNARYQRQKALIVTSNKTFSQWEELFPERLLAVALLDRLLHHGHALNIQGESYRLKHRREAGLAPLYSGS